MMDYEKEWVAKVKKVRLTLQLDGKKFRESLAKLSTIGVKYISWNSHGICVASIYPLIEYTGPSVNGWTPGFLCTAPEWKMKPLEYYDEHHEVHECRTMVPVLDADRLIIDYKLIIEELRFNCVDLNDEKSVNKVAALVEAYQFL